MGSEKFETIPKIFLAPRKPPGTNFQTYTSMYIGKRNKRNYLHCDSFHHQLLLQLLVLGEIRNHSQNFSRPQKPLGTKFQTSTSISLQLHLRGIITVTILIICSCNFWCSEKFETIPRIFLAPENPQVPIFRPLPQYHCNCT